MNTGNRISGKSGSASKLEGLMWLRGDQQIGGGG